MVWWAYQEGRITKLALRTYFGSIELEVRRRLSGGKYQPTFEELRKLVGGEETGRGLRQAVNQLLKLGLLKTCSKLGISFAEAQGELRLEDASGLEAILAKLRGVTRKVPVPRRMIRRLAGGLSKARTATVLAHLIRCLFYHRGEGVNPVGCCKASWVADVFGVTVRSVFDARRFLVLNLGWLQAEECSQHVLNRDGLWVTVNLDWGSEEQGTPAESSTTAAVEAPAPTDGFSGPRLENAGHFAGPSTDKEPLRENKNQKPASRPSASGEPAGFSQSNSTEKNPDLRNVVPEDLRDATRLLDLHRQAVEACFISSSEADKIAFISASAHAQAVGLKPCRLFAWMVRGKRFEFITQADEDAARSLLRPPPISHERERLAPIPPPRLEETLSTDALLARSVQTALARAGYRGDPLPLVRRERPEWTRERLDAAIAELERSRSMVRLNPMISSVRLSAN